jgi:hypothetical protein
MQKPITEERKMEKAQDRLVALPILQKFFGQRLKSEAKMNVGLGLVINPKVMAESKSMITVSTHTELSIHWFTQILLSGKHQQELKNQDFCFTLVTTLFVAIQSICLLAHTLITWLTKHLKDAVQIFLVIKAQGANSLWIKLMKYEKSVKMAYQHDSLQLITKSVCRPSKRYLLASPTF